MAQEHSPRKGLVRIDVTGEDSKLWAGMRGKLILALEQVIDTMTEGQGTPWFKEQAQEFTRALLENAKARLAKAGLQNQRIGAEIGKLYAERHETLAKARKTHAEAEVLEFNTAIRKLTIALQLTKAMLLGEAGEESTIFGSQIEGFLAAVRGLPEEEPAPAILESTSEDGLTGNTQE